mmetsp:Transcript_78347/g.227326  ORF Transcript_78347/g.227326 Transcript_78347/m.227326 type:complete len:323 (+) Transcript_78347:150-1118(+)
MLGAGAEAKLAKQRVLLRITLIGKSGSGKTSLINAIVNNNFIAGYQATECLTLYYAVLSVQEEDADKDAPKFNTIVELEDTPGSDTMDSKQILNLFDPWWPKPQDVAMKRPPRITDKTSCHLPFSITYAPVGAYNDEEAKVEECEQGINAGKWYCKRPEVNCSETMGRQCKSCRRFQESLTSKGEYRPLSRQRMAYIFTFDANDPESYMEALKIYNDYQVFLSKKEFKQKALLYLVGTKIDADPEGRNFLQLTTHMREFATEQSEDMKQLSTNLVSAQQFKGVQELFKGIVRELRPSEPLWKLNPLGETTDEEGDASKCSVQ